MKPASARPACGCSEADARRLSRYDWPGNVRELQNVIERAVILSHNGRLRIDLPDQAAHAPVAARDAGQGSCGVVLTDDEVRAFERANIVAALKAASGKVFGSGGAAELMDVKPTTLASTHQGVEDRSAGIGPHVSNDAGSAKASRFKTLLQLPQHRVQIPHHIRLAHIHHAIVPRLQPRPPLGAILYNLGALVRADQLDRQRDRRTTRNPESAARPASGA